ncbi:MAG: cellulase family glycosylhydrolase [Cyclobacteriaceae bacterium]
MTQQIILKKPQLAKTALVVLTCFLAFASANQSAAQQVAEEDLFAFAQNERLGKGVNIIGYDPIWNDTAKARMKKKHFRLIKEAGFDNVRIKISPFRFSRDEKFTIDPKFFTTLDWAIKQSLDNDLMVIVDFHEHGAMQENPISTQPMFLAMWKQIAEFLKDEPDEVLFEVANEPNMDPEIWNDLHAKAHKIIRESNPYRTLLLGPIYGNQIKRLKDLTLPEEDRNIIVAIHYYSPIEFTHQGAPWSKNNKDLSGITWTGTEEEKLAVQEDFEIATRWAKKYKRPLTLGEFGAYDKAELQYREIWTNYIAREAEARNWSWSYWQFDSDFIVYDLDKDEWFTPIKNALVPSGQGTINTVQGIRTSDQLGFALTHEHLFSNFGKEPGLAKSYDEAALMAQVVPYLRKLKLSGVQAIFDCTTAYFGRRVDLLEQIADQTGIDIITNTGFYGAADDRYVPEMAKKATAQEIAAIWIEEFENGIDGTIIKPGFIKLAFDEGKPSKLDLKLFESGVITSKETGLAMAVHTVNNKAAVEAQIKILEKYKVPLSAWVWVHADKFEDVNYQISLADKGAWISLDRVKEKEINNYIQKLDQFKSAGLLHKILLSHDGNSFTVGGELRPYEAIMDGLIPAMKSAGFSQGEINLLMMENPTVAFGLSKINSIND